VRRDGQGRSLTADRRNYYGHLKWLMDREVTRRSESALDRSPARELFARTAATLGLPPVVLAEAERVFQAATQRGAFRGRNLGSSVGASLYAACRRFGLPRTLGEVSKAVGSRRSELGRAFKALSRNLGAPLPAVNLHSYLNRYAEELALSPQVRGTVEEMLREAQTHPEVSGLSPHGLVAALIYLASEKKGEPRSRTQVAKVGSVTEVTLRSTSRTLTRLLGATPRPEAEDS
jgi:transcription initiation factor TFIIB